MRFVPRAFVFVLGLSLGVPALALVEPAPSARFADRVKLDPAGAIGAAAERPEALPGFDAERTLWAQFAGRAGGAWTLHVDRRSGAPLLVEGSGIAWFDGARPAPAVTTLEALARQLLRENVRLFHIDDAELVLDAAGSRIEDGGRAVLVFDRAVQGVPVVDQRVIFHVNHGRLVAFGTDRWGEASAPSLTPALDAAAASRALLRYAGISPAETIDVVAARRVLVAAPPAGATAAPRYAGRVGGGIAFRAAWEFALRVAGTPGTWVGRVDDTTGEVLAFFDDNRYGQAKGGVFPVSDDGIGADGTEQPGWPMPYADMTLGAAPQTANDMGMFSCSPAGSVATTTLAGPYVRVHTTCGAVNEAVTCDADLDLAQGAGTDCSVPAGASAGDTHSARSSFYHLNRVMEKGRAWLPGNAWLQSQLTDNLDIFSTCNAYWDGASVNFYRSGGGCRNTGEIAGVFVHEWGHGLDANDGGGYDNPSEAYADIVAFLQTHVSCIGRGFWSDNHNCGGYGDTCLNCSGIRDQDWNMHQSKAAVNAAWVQSHCGGGGGPCGREVHCEGYLAGQTLWDLAARDLPAAGFDADSAWQLADKLFYTSRQGSGGNAYNCALPSSDGCGATSWYTKLRNADDDDGNLANGTPHAAAIFAAFSRHGIACGAAGDAANQNHSACSALAAPVLTAVAGSNAASLSWTAVSGAARYLVLRNDQGCHAGYTVVATVAAPATSYTDDGLPNGFPVYYAVQAQAANAACESKLSNCQSVAPQPFAGVVRLDRPLYGCSTPIVIKVTDANIGGATTTATIVSTSEAAPETVLLTQVAPGSPDYTGTIQATPDPSPTGDGKLTLHPGDAIVAHYVDADDGSGGHNLLREASAGTDCTGPVISGTAVSGVSDTQATLTWTTDKASDTRVHWGDVRPPANLAMRAESATAHTLTLTGLAACTTYYASAESQDAAGNVALDDAHGADYTFETLGDFGAGLTNCHTGHVALPSPTVACSGGLTVQVTDLDANVSASVADTLYVTVSSSSEPTPETLALRETGPNTSVFSGAITLTAGAPVAGDGHLSVADGDTLTATYRDANDGTGHAAVVYATGLADCAAPVTNGLGVGQVDDESAWVMWTSSEPSIGAVQWGPTTALGTTLSETDPTTTHQLLLRGMQPCTRYYFRATDTDMYGNVATYDQNGAPFTFNAFTAPGRIYKDNFETNKGWTLQGEWQIDTPRGLGTNFADPVGAYNGTKALGHDLTGLGTYPGDYEPGTTQSATSPKINATGLSHAELDIQASLGANYGQPATVLVLKNGTWNQVWSSDPNGGSHTGGWAQWTFDISMYADNNAQLQIRFSQNGGAAGSGHACGWTIDQMQVRDGWQTPYDACRTCAGTPSFAGLTSAIDADPCAASGILLSWNWAPAMGTGYGGTYIVYRDTVPNFTPSAANRIAFGIWDQNYLDTTAPPNTTLYYLVRAESDETCSTGPANGGVMDANLVYRSARDATSQPVPGSIGSTLRGTLENLAHVRLTWGAAANAARYHVQRAGAAAGPFDVVGDVAVPAWEDLDQAGDPATWYYLVRGADACGNEGP